ncbi:MAG TPA: hypothetical protein VMB18_16510 [Terriglobales bacterium]|nr:hypothetical protein [Terriglobales bacterium]
MSRYRFVNTFALALTLVIAASVLPSAFAQQSPAAPAAFVYVSSNPSGSTYQVNAYSAASNGQLTPVPGSPFPANVQQMAVNGKYLFGTDGTYIYSFAIAANGALRQVASINVQENNGGCGSAGALFLDHTGATLYDWDYDGNDCANNAYQSFSVNQSTGQLTYLGGDSVGSEYFQQGMSFIANNQYAYGSSCYHFSPEIYGFQRESSGLLNLLNVSPSLPNGPTGSFYCPTLASADPSGNVAITMVPLNDSSWQPTGPYQIAVYTADSSGILTTSSTYSNMPPTRVQTVLDYWMSPAGNLLAVGGTGGAQVFHFNGSNPATHYTGLLTTQEVDQVLWDNANHLYGIGRQANSLFVGTVTPTKLSTVQGSPYSITNPVNLVVLPK